MEARIRDPENQIGVMAKKLNQNSIRDHVNTDIESPFSSQITRFAILLKFKQSHLDSYNY